jgi:hypothetical protein
VSRLVTLFVHHCQLALGVGIYVVSISPHEQKRRFARTAQLVRIFVGSNSEQLSANKRFGGDLHLLRMRCLYCNRLDGAPRQKGQMPLQDFRASVYPFCACAQAMESDRLVNIADQNDEWWAEVAKWYHEKIAKHDSDEHRENMLRGYPTRKLLRFLTAAQRVPKPPAFEQSLTQRSFPPPPEFAQVPKSKSNPQNPWKNPTSNRMASTRKSSTRR